MFSRHIWAVVLFFSVAWSLSPRNTVTFTPDYPSPVATKPPKLDENVNVIRYLIDPLSETTYLISTSPIPTGINVQDKTTALLAVEKFWRKYSNLFGIPFEQLKPVRLEFMHDIWYIDFKQQTNNYEVLRSYTYVRLNKNGEIILVRNNAKPLFFTNNPSVNVDSISAISIAVAKVEAKFFEIAEQKLAIAPIPAENRYDGRLVWNIVIKTQSPPGLLNIWVDAENGEILRLYDELPTLIYGTVTGYILPRRATDTQIEMPFPHQLVRIGSNSAYTNESGTYSADIAPGTYLFYTTLAGRYCQVYDNISAVASFSENFTGEEYNFTWLNSNSPIDQRNAYYHVNFMHDYVKNFLGFSLMDYRMPARVNNQYMPDNAYWDGEGVNFGAGSGEFYDFSLFAEVIYHEYGHGVTDHIYSDDELPYEGQSGAINEALSDYYACTITNDPLVCEGIYISNPSMAFRNLQNSNRYPENYVDEVHHDSQIISGAWWEIRTALGSNYTDSLVHGARLAHATDFESYLYEMLIWDDDDGDISNGTPNSPVIYTAYYNHGIGPETLLALIHTPHHDEEETTGTYRITAKVKALLGTNQIRLCWRIFGTVDTNCGEMNLSGVDSYYYEIPAQRWGTRIQYHIRVWDRAGNIAKSPETAPVGFHTFYVRRDTIAPEISHIPITGASVLSWSPAIFARITENGVINFARVEYAVNGTPKPPVNLAYNPSKNGWIGYFGSPVNPDDYVEYRIVASDLSAAENTSYFPPSGYIGFSVTQNYNESFETGCYDYEVTPGNLTSYVNQWHIETYRKHSGYYSYKFGGEGSSPYSDLAEGCLITPPIWLGTNARLIFWQWIAAETSNTYTGYAWDGGIVEISIDGAPWEQITPVGGYPFRIRENPVSPFPAETRCFSGRRNWQQVTFTFEPYNCYVRFRFRFGSDGYVTGEGWYIDDITVESDFTYVLEENKWLPSKLAIKTFPNPFNENLQINVAIPQKGYTKICVQDILGKNVATLFNGNADEGVMKLNFDAGNLANGIYFIKTQSGNESVTSKVILLK